MDSSQDEIGASAILGAQLDEELGGGPVQVKGIVLFATSCFLGAFLHLVFHVVKVSALL